MKKRFYLLGMLAAGLTFAGCTDDIDDATGSGVTSGDKGYVKIAINLPTTSGQSTRSENDDFEDGLEEEYAVNDAYLLLFGGNDESSATLQSWYKINTSFSGVGTDDDNITTQSEVIKQIVKPTGTNTYALVVLNNNENLTFAVPIEGINGAGKTVTIGGTSVSTLANLQSALAKEVTAFIGANSNSFTMTNAPIASLSGSDSDLSNQSVSTLVKLDVFDSEEDAEQDMYPDQIYVERVAAKVTVSYTNNLFTKDDAENKYFATLTKAGQYTGDKVFLEGWYLNVTNKSTKFVRDVKDWSEWKDIDNSSNVNENRFFGTNSPFRVYWAIDGNYNDLSNDESILKAAFNIGENSNGLISGANVFSTPAYCLENTMDYDHMWQRETTGIVFKMTYLFDADRDPKTFYILGDPATAEPKSGDELVVSVNTALGSASQTFTVALKDNPEGGYYSTVGDMQRLFKKNDGGELLENEALSLIAALSDQTIRVYENGATYYYASRIQHFGDTYCKIPNGYVDEVSDYTDQHLGRYGVVRNNWYEILINSISGPGRPTPPDPTDEDDPDYPKPDDPKDDAFINCRINILSWAKRSQNVDL